MSDVVGVICPKLQDSLLKAFAEVDPPNSRVREDSLKLQLYMCVCVGEIGTHGKIGMYMIVHWVV